jgi:hypothetical protein
VHAAAAAPPTALLLARALNRFCRRGPTSNFFPTRTCGGAGTWQVAAIYDEADGGAVTAAGVARFVLRVADMLVGVAPVRDIAVGEAASSAVADWGVDPRRGPPQLVACVGDGRTGGLAVLRQGLVPELITAVPLPGALAWQGGVCLSASRSGDRYRAIQTDRAGALPWQGDGPIFRMLSLRGLVHR